MNLDDEEMRVLNLAFKDLLNYESADPDSPINPLAYREPGGDSCLHIAAYRGDCVAVRILLKAGLDVNSIGEMGCTPLHYATQRGHTKIAELLIKSGASKNIRNKFGELPVVP